MKTTAKNTFRHYALLSTLCAACASSTGPSPKEPAEAESPPSSEPMPEPAGRPELTAEECEAKRATVVGDIGDGAIHRPDYTCPSGAAPIGNIRATPGGPMAVEGAVCCPQ